VALPVLPNVFGQATNATLQTASPRVAVSRSAVPVRSIAKPAIAPQLAPRLGGVNQRMLNSPAPHGLAQPSTNRQQHTYSPLVRISNSALAPSNTHQAAPGQEAMGLDPATRQNELRTLEAVRQRRGFVNEQVNTLDPATRETEIHTLSAMHEQRGIAHPNQTLATLDPQRHITTHDHTTAAQPETQESHKHTQAKKSHHKKDNSSFDQAFRRHWHGWHDRNWWHDHCDTIVFVTTGYYFLDGSYWYPAFGYDPLNSYYDYDGPVYTYGDLLPDEVIANVQTALQDAGYYYGDVTGSLAVDTRAALANFQRDYGLPISGAIDEATVEALGLY